MSINDRDWSVTDTVTVPKVYIEKEAVKSVADKLIEELECMFDNEEIDEGQFAYLVSMANRDITIPPADVRPVVRGEWELLSYDEALCSHCGYVRGTPFECTKEAKARWDEELPPFCEMCGADMRKE